MKFNLERQQKKNEILTQAFQIVTTQNAQMASANFGMFPGFQMANNNSRFSNYGRFNFW